MNQTLDTAISTPLSKTQRKKAMLGLQALGQALIELNEAQLKGLELPDDLAAAIQEMKRTKTHEGKRRQLQYIGRIMRQVDAEPIAVKLEQLKQPGRQEIARLHRVEQWRERLLNDATGFTALQALKPGVDMAKLQKLVATVKAEAAQARPPKAFRDLFRELAVCLDD